MVYLALKNVKIHEGYQLMTANCELQMTNVKYAYVTGNTKIDSVTYGRTIFCHICPTVIYLINSACKTFVKK